MRTFARSILPALFLFSACGDGGGSSQGSGGSSTSTSVSSVGGGGATSSSSGGGGSGGGGGSEGMPWDGKELPTDPDLPKEQVQIPAVPGGAPAFKVDSEAALVAALAAAKLGDKIEITQSFSVSGPVTLPNKGPGEQYITLYSTGWDSAPPVPFAENTGSAPHVSPSTPMFTISTKGNGAFDCAPGAHHVHFVGIELNYDPSVTDSSGLLRIYVPTQTQASETPHHIIADRMRLRGDAGPGGANLRRAVIMNGDHIAVHQSYIDGFYDNNSDSQAVGSWSGNGPLRITNSFLEGAAENVIVGGADPSFPTGIPADIEVRFNHLYKRNAWLKTGHTKNLFELKFARRILVEANVLENYAEDAQDSAVNLKVNNPATASGETGHVTFRYNRFTRLDAGLFKVGTVLADAGGPAPVPTHDVLLSNNLVDGDYNTAATSWFLLLVNSAAYPMQNIALRHNTAVGNENTSVSIGAPEPSITGLSILDNIFSTGQYGVKAGGTTAGTPSLEACAPGAYTFTGNVMQGMGGGTYPPGNPVAATINDIGFTSWSPGGGSDLTLTAASPYKKGASDGKDPGADVAQVTARIAGVAYTPDVP